jgi:hypothetical protein
MATLTLRPDAAAGVDTFLQQSAPDTVYGTNVGLQLRSKATGAARYSLLKFDLSALIGATVVSATLTLTDSGTGAASDYNVGIHAILAANAGWDELSTWNYKTPSTVRWAGDAGADGGTDAGCSVAGTDYNAVAMGSFTAVAPHATDEKYNVALNVAQFQAMVAANYGMVLVIAEDILEALYSSDHATESRRPLLVVEYIPGTGMMRAPFWGRF